MRLIGLAERTLEKMCHRAQGRVAFGKPLSEQTVTQERIAEARIMIEQSRLLTLKAAHMMDTVGNKIARSEIAMIKVAVPNMACRVIDWAIQMFGAGGTGNDYGLALAYATARLLRIADGPDEVYRNQIARLEMRRYPAEEAVKRPPAVERVPRALAEKLLCSKCVSVRCRPGDPSYVRATTGRALPTLVARFCRTPDVDSRRIASRASNAASRSRRRHAASSRPFRSSQLGRSLANNTGSDT
jgi:hypothetical protein